MRALALLLALTIIGCTSPTLPEERELTVALARWDARAFPDYEMEIRINCFCATELGEWSRVRVERDSVTQVMRLSDSTVVAPSLWPMWHSIDRIFDRLRDVHGSDVYPRFIATFDPVLGFPREASLIQRPDIADAGIAWSVRRVVAINTTHVP